ncbi:MAG: hypothetical protein II870_00560 [Synergistaceae bacterium]|nr:hypothetical protein [Synergistaceae bacterium]
MQDIKDITAITAAMLREKARAAVSPRQDLIFIKFSIKNLRKREAQA